MSETAGDAEAIISKLVIITIKIPFGKYVNSLQQGPFIGGNGFSLLALLLGGGVYDLSKAVRWNDSNTHPQFWEESDAGGIGSLGCYL